MLLRSRPSDNLVWWFELNTQHTNILGSRADVVHFYLQRRLHGGNGSGVQRLGLTLIPAVGVTDAQEEHAGGQASWQRQGHVAAEVCSTGSRSHWSTTHEWPTLNTLTV